MKKVIYIVTNALAVLFFAALLFETARRMFTDSDLDPLVPLIAIMLTLIGSAVMQQYINIATTQSAILGGLISQHQRESLDQYIPNGQQPDLN